MHRSLNIFAISSVISAASPAIAQQTHSASIVATTADFATKDARAALDRRIQSAAEEVCGANANEEGMDWGQIKQCRLQIRDEIYQRLASLRKPQMAQLKDQ